MMKKMVKRVQQAQGNILHKMFGGAPLAIKEECCFSILCAERPLDFYADNEEQRDRCERARHSFASGARALRGSSQRRTKTVICGHRCSRRSRRLTNANQTSQPAPVDARARAAFLNFGPGETVANLHPRLAVDPGR